MNSTHLAYLLQPIAYLILFGCILLPIRYAVKHWLPEGRFKRLLLHKVY